MNFLPERTGTLGVSAKRSSPFQVIAKPAGPLCNLACRYCFYLEKEKIFSQAGGGTSNRLMSEKVLETYIRQKLENSSSTVESFLWQGGEPTLTGVDYFRKIIKLQQRYARGKRINNAIQTNAVLLDDEWGLFLKENNFLVGVSIDGPGELHNKYRLDRQGKPSFEKVMQGIGLLQEYQIEFNTLTTVHQGNSTYPLEIYNFLKTLKPSVMQFIPIVEITDDKPFIPNSNLMSESPHLSEVSTTVVSEWSVLAEDYGLFLTTVFDKWVHQDVGTHFVQNFEVSLEAWYGQPSSLCVFDETCGRDPVIEHNGDLFACDHYVYPEYKFGNILKNSLDDFMQSPRQIAFGRAKRDTLPKMCLACQYRFACHGGCPKHRFLSTPAGEPGLNYLCAGYRHYFEHVEPYMRYMANELHERRSPASVMSWAKELS